MVNRKGRQQPPFGALAATSTFGAGGAFGQPAVSQNLFQQRMLFERSCFMNSQSYFFHMRFRVQLRSALRRAPLLPLGSSRSHSRLHSHRLRTSSGRRRSHRQVCSARPVNRRRYSVSSRRLRLLSALSHRFVHCSERLLRLRRSVDSAALARIRRPLRLCLGSRSRRSRNRWALQRQTASSPPPTPPLRHSPPHLLRSRRSNPWRFLNNSRMYSRRLWLQTRHLIYSIRRHYGLPSVLSELRELRPLRLCRASLVVFPRRRLVWQLCSF